MKICKYNIVLCFKLHRITFFLSLNDKTSPKPTKALVVRSMFVTFLQEVKMCHIRLWCVQTRFKINNTIDSRNDIQCINRHKDMNIQPRQDKQYSHNLRVYFAFELNTVTDRVLLYGNHMTNAVGTHYLGLENSLLQKIIQKMYGNNTLKKNLAPYSKLSENEIQMFSLQ